MLLLCLWINLICFSSTFAKRGGYSGNSGRTGSNYPPSQGLSGSNAYPSHNYPSSTRLSGNSYRPNGQSYQKTEVHHHYNYAPPQSISYGSSHHPVYHGTPPVYVYEYRNSGSRFDTLLTGLALYNLGRMSVNRNHYNQEYRGNPGEMCKMVISKSNGEYEETRIDCRLMSSFIWDAEREGTSTVTKTVNVAESVIKEGNSTITVQNTTIVDALQVKGPSIDVNPGMSCFMIRISRDSSKLKRKVDCVLLQEYAQRSLRYNSGHKCFYHVTTLVLSFFLCLRVNVE